MRNLLVLLFSLSFVLGQINDKNFKETINGGTVVAVFTSEWQEQPFDKDIVSGVKGYEDCEIIYVKSEDAPKSPKNLDLETFHLWFFSMMAQRKRLGKQIWMVRWIVIKKILKKQLMISMRGMFFSV